MSKHNTLNRRLAEAAFTLLSSRDSITFADITKAEFGVSPDDLIAVVHHRRGSIRRQLQANGMDCSLVNEFYFNNFRFDPPSTLDEARKCLPMRAGKSTERLNTMGLCRANGHGTSMIFRVYEEATMESSAGGVKRTIERTVDAIGHGSLSTKTVAKMIRDGAKKMRPEISQQARNALEISPIALLE